MRLRITGTDLLTLDVHANVIARIDDIAAADAAAEEAEAGDDAEAEEGAGPLTLAIDVQSDDAADASIAQPSETPA